MFGAHQHRTYSILERIGIVKGVDKSFAVKYYVVMNEAQKAARLLGRLGGLKGGPARAKKLSAKRRREIAQKAIRTRWAKAKADAKSAQ